MTTRLPQPARTLLAVALAGTAAVATPATASQHTALPLPASDAAPPAAARLLARQAMTGLTFSAGRDGHGARAFVAEFTGGQVRITRDGPQLALTRPATPPATATALLPPGAEAARAAITRGSSAPLTMRFLHPSGARRLTADGRLPGVLNDLRGNDPSRWRTEQPTFGAVHYQDLYDGIGLRYDGQHGTLKGTFTIAAGTDPSVIRWQYGPGTGVRLSPSGDLALTLPGRQVTLLDRAPIAWQQDRAGQRRPVPIRYRLDHGTVGFRIGSYDQHRPLVIDPELVYSFALGQRSPAIDTGSLDLAQSPDGALFVVGATSHGDGVLVKVTPDGVVRFRTLLGGEGNTTLRSVALDHNGGIHLAGFSDAADFPVRHAAQPRIGDRRGTDGRPLPSKGDAVVVTLDKTGSRLTYSTYLGGAQGDNAKQLTALKDGTVLVVGGTSSCNFPQRRPLPQPPNRPAPPQTQPECDRGFLTQYDPAGRLLRSTFVGGSYGLYGSQAFGVTVSPRGTVLVSGWTAACDIRTARVLVGCTPVHQTNPAPDVEWHGFVAQLNRRLDRIEWVAYFGGDSPAYLGWALTVVTDVAVTSDGRAVWLTGFTTTADMPVTGNAAQPAFGGGVRDGFVAKLTPNNEQPLVYSTFLGGEDNENTEWRIALDRHDGPVVASSSFSYAYPTTAGSFQPRNASTPLSADVVLTRLNPAGALTVSSYLGGRDTEAPSGPVPLLVASNGDVIVTGFSNSPDFPVRGHSRPIRSSGDTFLTRLDSPGCTAVTNRLPVPCLPR